MISTKASVFGIWYFFQVSRAFGIPQKKNICISLVLVAHFQGHRYPLPPIGVGSIYLQLFTVFYFIVFLATHCILFIVFLHGVRYCMQYSSFFYGVLFFLLIFCHYFSVSVVSFFAVVCEWCEQCGSCAFQNCEAGEASFSHVLRCWFCCSLYYSVFISLKLCH